MHDVRVGVIGATGAVGRMTIALLRERGYGRIRLFASARSAGTEIDGRIVEEATQECLDAGELDVALFSAGTSASSELVPHAIRGGALVVDKSSAFRLVEGVPLVVPEVNPERAFAHSGVIANPNCCAIPLACALKPLHDAAGLRSVRVATYQSASGAGAAAMARLQRQHPGSGDLAMDWEYDGEELDEETKLRDETRKILGLPELPVSATCIRVPVLVGHAEAVWIETEERLSREQALQLLAAAPSLRLDEFPTPGRAAGDDHVFVGRVRESSSSAGGGLTLLLACDNLRKGAALNAIQITELVLGATDREVAHASADTRR